MNHFKLSFLLLSILISINTFSQTDIVIGKNHTIKSTFLNQDRQIQIYLPSGYDTSNIKYPVLYILDGQWYFSNGVAIQQSLRVPDRLPEMIVIGIQNKNPLRRTLFWEERAKFLSFLTEEVNAFVENNFRASEDRILFGWEAGAFFAGYALLHEKQFFNAAILTNGAYADEEMIQNFNKNSTNSKYLFIANSTKDIYYISSTESLNKLLSKKKPNNLIWKYQQFNEEIHESLAYLALYHGLNYYFHNYESLVFSSIKEYEESGGLPYLQKYFKERGERYGFPTEIDNATKNGLIWLTWNRNDFKAFKFFMNEFQEVLSTKRYDSAYWQNRFAQFYLKHNDAQKAIAYFNNGITNYPESSRLALMHSGLGDAYLKAGNNKKAIEHIEKAIAIAKINSDTDLKKYESKLLELRR